ncbi:MAG: hypothetical protein K2J51_09640, partial [Alistipes sp.]|nr:hypothetical protein [Alistipes sp.]
LILSLLGFSTACSGLKNGARSETPAVDADTTAVETPRIHVMYGVRTPRPASEADVESLGADSSAVNGSETPAEGK